jgi:carboxyl-terminal processing protease
MLYTLDPHSVLLDVETYKDMRTQTQGKFGGLGIVIEMDKKNRITVKRPMPDTPASAWASRPRTTSSASTTSRRPT